MGEKSKPTFASVEERRQAVGELYWRNVPVYRISTMLKVPRRTIRGDIDILKKELAAERVADIEARRDRTLAELRTVLSECWSRLARLKDFSNNVSGILNTIVATEKLIAQLEGTLDSSTKITQNVHTGMSNEEWEAVQTKIVSALASYPAAQLAVAEALAPMEDMRARLN